MNFLSFFRNAITNLFFGEINFFAKILYALPRLFRSIQASFQAWVRLYYVEKLLLDPKYGGLADGLTGALLLLLMPLSGYILDYFIQSDRWGRRFPVLVVTAPLATLSFIPIFFVPKSIIESGSQTELALWFTLWHMTFNITGRMWNGAYDALGVSLVTNHHERSILFGLSFVALKFGAIIGDITPGYFPDQYTNMSLYAGAGFFVTAMLSHFILKEGSPPSPIESQVLSTLPTEAIPTNDLEKNDAVINSREDTMQLLDSQIIEKKPTKVSNEKKPYFVCAMIQCGRNTPFLTVLCVMILSGSYLLGYRTPLALRILFTANYQQVTNYRVAMEFVGMVVAPFWLFVARIISKRLATLIGFLVGGLSMMMVLFIDLDNPNSLPIWTFLILQAITLSAFNALQLSLLADVVDYDQFIWGSTKRREAMYTIIFNEGLQLDQVLTSLGQIALSASGYDSRLARQSPLTLMWVRLLVGFNGLAQLLASFLLIFYPITQKVHEKILEGIKVRRTRNVIDPITQVELPFESVIEEETIFDHFVLAELKLFIKKGSTALLIDIVLQLIIFSGVGVFLVIFLALTYDSLAKAFQPVLLMVCALCFGFAMMNYLRFRVSEKLFQYPLAGVQRHINNVSLILRKPAFHPRKTGLLLQKIV